MYENTSVPDLSESKKFPSYDYNHNEVQILLFELECIAKDAEISISQGMTLWR